MADVTQFNAAVAAAQELRRELHRHPELAFAEHETSARMVAELVRIGLPDASIRRTAGTGLVVDIAGLAPPTDAPGPQRIALRADMDGLPIAEENDLPYKSRNEGRMHACGHDGHMAMLLGAASIIASAAVRARIPSNRIVRLLLQPAEEAEGGAEPMIADGCLDGVDEVYGAHNIPMVPLGSVTVKAGPVMAHVAELDVKVTGRGGHGSQPQACIDPILISAHLVTALQSVVSRSLHPRDSAVVSITNINGGTGAYNIIPESVTLSGTLRDFDPAVFETISTRIHAICDCTARAFGGIADTRIRSLYPVTCNSVTETGHVQRLSARVLGADRVSEDGLPLMASEDFAYYTQVKPGAFFFVGGAEPGRLVGAGLLHTATFDFNDNSVPIGMKVFLALVDDRLGLGGLLIDTFGGAK